MKTTTLLLCFFISIAANAQLSLTTIKENTNRFILGIHADSSGYKYIRTSEGLLRAGSDNIWTFVRPSDYLGYCLGKDQNWYAFNKDIFQKSIDHGETWDTLSTNLPHFLDQYTAEIEVDQNGKILLQASDGVFVSNDNGQSWDLTHSYQSSFPNKKRFQFENGDVWRRSWDGDTTIIKLSVDDGIYWKTKLAVKQSYWAGYHNKIQPGSGNHLYYLVNYNNKVDFYHSADYGETWTNATLDSIVTVEKTTQLHVLPNDSLLLHIRLEDVNPVIYPKTNFWYVSSNHGQSWVQIDPEWDNWISSIWVTEDDKLYGLGAIPLHELQNDWETLEYAGFGLTAPLKVQWANQNEYYELTEKGLVRNVNGNADYINLLKDLTPDHNCPSLHWHYRFLPVLYLDDLNNLFIGNCNTLVRSTNQGAGFDTIFHVQSSLLEDQSIVDFEVFNGKYYLLLDYNLLVSEDEGQSWNVAIPDSPVNFFKQIEVFSGSELYVVSEYDLWRSLDGGATLTKLLEECCIIQVFKGENGEPWVNKDQRLYRYDLNNNNLNPLGITPTADFASWIIESRWPSYFFHEPTNTVYCTSRYNGKGIVCASSDQGQSWEITHTPHKEIRIIGFFDDYIHLYTPISHSGINSDYLRMRALFRSLYPLGPVSSQYLNSDKELFIHPNPASTQLTLETPDHPGISQIQLFNANGREVLRQPINQKTSTLNVSQLSKGVYFLNWIDGSGRILASEKVVLK